MVFFFLNFANFDAIELHRKIEIFVCKFFFHEFLAQKKQLNEVLFLKISNKE